MTVYVVRDWRPTNEGPVRVFANLGSALADCTGGRVYTACEVLEGSICPTCHQVVGSPK